MSRRDSEKWILPFVAALERLLGTADRPRDVAVLAKLRRGVAGHSAERDAWVFAHLRGAAPRHESYALQVASLFALWCQGGGTSSPRLRGTLGTSFRMMADKERCRLGLGATDAVPSVERRFTSLLDSHPDDLPQRLRQVVSLLRSHDVAIDWAQLIYDLLDWENPNRAVQRKWARDYWASGNHDASSTDTEPAVTQQSENPKTESEEAVNDS